MEQLEQMDVEWFECPHCGRTVPLNQALAERRFNHIVIPNGDGTIKLLCPEDAIFR
jgi:hypothetical protein